MKCVFKYPLALVEAIQSVDMPADARIVAVQWQSGRPTLWAEVTPNTAMQLRRFSVYATGEPIPPRAQYVGTVFQANAILVWHVYEHPLS